MDELIDTGANLTHESFSHDLEPVIERAAAAGVRRMIVTGTTVEASEQALQLARQRPGRLFATAGIHPHHAQQWDAPARARLLELLRQPEVVAAGECGLDFFRNYAPPAAQHEAFDAQLGLAAESGKPVFLHQRQAHLPFLERLRGTWPDLHGGVAHCFTEGPGELEDYLELGLYIGITGWICDERRGQRLREAVGRLPLDRVLLETDAPYLLPRDAPRPPAGRRNEPALLEHIARVTARFMGCETCEVAQASTRNALTLFGIRDESAHEGQQSARQA